MSLAPPDLSVILCTHNPKEHYLTRVLSALREQSLPATQWELLVIDNASKQSVADGFDLSWHPRGRTVREENLGLTAARLRGFRESSAALIVMVDDDNVLEKNYLRLALEIGSSFPQLGAWGASVIGEFESKPPTWAVPQMGYLGIRPVEHAVWSNIPFSYAATPIGAGMVLRRPVVEAYTASQKNHPLRVKLDRVGDNLSSCGDHDLAFTACDIGLGTGVFPELELTHLIPVCRVTADYLLKLREGISYSTFVLEFIRGMRSIPPRLSWRYLWGHRRRMWIKEATLLCGSRFDRLVARAVARGQERAMRAIAEVQE